MSGMICETKSTMLPHWDETAFRDGTLCVVEFAKELLEQAKRESCGRDVLCREGTWQVAEIMRDITLGKGCSDDLALMQELLMLIKENASCEMAYTAATRGLELILKYPEEWDLHIRRKRCTNLVCEMSFSLYIDPERCDGCQLCVDKCPESAIRGGDNLIHVINLEACTKCLDCIEICPKQAIWKAGQVKPAVPVEPVPVGSFGNSAGREEESGGMRRRRRG